MKAPALHSLLFIAVGLAPLGCASEPDLPPEALFVAHDQVPPPAAPQPGDPHRPNVLVVVIESLDAQTVEDLRSDPDPAPNLARLMREGVSFDNAFTTGSWTMPGLAALLTGRYPRLDTRGSGAGMLSTQAGVNTLPEVMGLYGYTTVGIWGSTLACGVGSDLPFHHTSPLHCGPSATPFDQALRVWVEHYAREPFFALVHNIDLHTPEPSAPEGYLHRYTDDHPACPDAGTGFLYRDLEAEMGSTAAADHVVGHYRGQLAFYDRALGRMLDALDDAGALDDTVVVVTTNHGQDLFEHSCFDHGTLYDAVLHIPLVWWERDLEHRVVSEVVQNTDIMPSIFERAGVPYTGLDGRSLLPLMGLAAGSYEPRPVFSLSKGENASMRTPEQKLILSQGLRVGRCDAVRSPAPPSGRIPHYELYDLVADPGETVDLYPQQADTVSSMVAQLGAWLSQRRPSPGEHVPQVGERERRALQERGYWDLAGPSSDLPPPPRHGPPEGQRAHPPKGARPPESKRDD